MHIPTDLIGPDFLNRLAEQQLANGLELDASTLQANARAWNAERAASRNADFTIAQMERDIDRLEAQLRRVRAAAQEAEAT